jgi:ABC-type branched-subunit amino acid transport system substrate-binding protein
VEIMIIRFVVSATIALILCSTAMAEEKRAPGVSDTEIKLGQTFPYSGPASAYRTIANSQIAYFKMINEQGGINGRKINLISLDDAYSPSKTVEQTRKLVEQEEVAAMLMPLGTPTGLSVRKYLNDRNIPQLFIGSGASLFGDYKNYPWTMGFQPSYQTETIIYAKYILKTNPNAKIALFYQNDDSGRDYISGFKIGLGAEDAKRMIVAEASFLPTDPTIDSQIAKLKASGADTLFVQGIPRHAAMAIRKVYELDWRPAFFLAATSTSVSGVLEPAGLEKAKGIITAYYMKDPTDPQWISDKATVEWRDFMKKYYPAGDITDQLNVLGYTTAQVMVQLLTQCGDNLSRENIMRQAANLDIALPMLLPGIRVKTSATDYFPIEAQQLQRFNGKSWELFGDVIGD